MKTNNFRILYSGCAKNRPPYLEFYKEIDGFKIFKSTFNPLLYVIHNHIDNVWCPYEYEENTLASFEFDLETLIKFIFVPKIK